MPIGFYLIWVMIQWIRSWGVNLKDMAGYMIAGRHLSLPGLVASLVTGWYGGILGVGEYSFNYGISSWLVFGVPYYLAAILFAFFLSGRIRKSRMLTIPEQLEHFYGRKVSILGAGIIFIQSVPAAYILELGILIRFVTGWPLMTCIILGALGSTGYLFAGGFRMMVRNHLVQFGLMFLGFAMILAMCRYRFGGWEYLQQAADPHMFTWHGGNKPIVILIWYFLALSTLAEPLFYQQSAAARNPAVARWGILISVLFWILFDFMTSFTGIYAHAILHQIPDPVMAYPMLSQKILPPLLHGIFICSMLAVIMSTIDSFAFISGVTIGRDILHKLAPDSIQSGKNQKGLIQIGLILSSLFAIMIASLSDSVVQIWYGIGSIGIPAILVPVVSSYSRYPISRRSAAIIILGSSSLSLFWLATPLLFRQEGYLGGIEPVFPGLVWAMLVWGLSRIRALRSV